MGTAIKRLTIAILSFVFLFSGQSARAQTIWKCVYSAAGSKVAAPLTGTIIEVNSKRLDNFIDDDTGKRARFEIVENSGDALIAIFHFANPRERKTQQELGLKVIMLDEKSGDLRLISTIVPNSYLDAWTGKCSKATLP